MLLALAACSASPRPGSGAADSALAPATSAVPVPGSAPPAVPGPVTITVPAASVPGPAAPGSTAHATATCPAGSALVGGGANVRLHGGGTPSPSLHFNGTAPTSPSAWTSVGATGGQVVLGGETVSLAVCAALPGLQVQVVSASVPGPVRAATTARATAACPVGTQLVGGGGSTAASGSSPSLHLLGTFPSTGLGAPAPPGPVPGYWSAVADSGGRGGAGARTTAFALCAPGPPTTAIPAVQVVVATVAGPTSPATSMSARAACPSGTSLLSGGVNAGLRTGQAPQQGVHLTGSFPAAAPGSPSGSFGAWTGRAESGGQSTPNTQTSAFALCAG